MYRLKVALYIVVLLFLSFTGCDRGSGRIECVMRQAEYCMDERPDSALQLLQTISSPTSLRGKEQADYALLYTQACDKNYMTSASDSLIRIAVDYYGKDGGMKAALSYFYLGCVCWNGNSNVEAVEAFLKALEALPSNATDRLLMQIHVYLGECYNSEGLYQDAKEHYWLAYQNASHRKDTIDMFYPLSGLGSSYLFLMKNDSAVAYYNKALDISNSVGNVDMKRSILSGLVGYYELTHEYEKVNQYASAIIGLGDDDLSNMYRAKGKALMNMGQLDSACYFLNLSLSSSSLATRSMGYYSLYELFKEKRDMKLTEYVDSFIIYKDSLSMIERYDEIQVLKERYAEQTRKQDFLQYKNRLKLYWWTFSLVVLMMGVVVFLIVDKRRKQHFAKLQQRLAESKIDNMKRYVQEEFGETIVLDAKLKELEEEAVKSCVRAFQQSVWYKMIANLDGQYLSAKEQRELFKDLSSLFADFIETLKGEYPEIKEQDVYFCILSVIGYRLRIVAFCLRTTDRNLSTRKSRLKKVLSKSVFEFVFASH